jgi:carboxymethylenebutenolidase
MHARRGLQPFYKDVADDLAREGFVGFSVAWQTRVPPNDDNIMPTDQSVMDVLADGVAYLRAQPFVDGERLGIMGFCAGGTLVYLALSTLEVFTSGVPHYGSTHGSAESRAISQDGKLPTAYELADRVRASLLIIGGAEDRAVPVEGVRQYAEKLRANGQECEVEIYPGAGHAFTIKGGRSYLDDAAQDAWRKTVAHFKRTLAA